MDEKLYRIEQELLAALKELQTVKQDFLAGRPSAVDPTTSYNSLYAMALRLKDSAEYVHKTRRDWALATWQRPEAGLAAEMGWDSVEDELEESK